MGAVLQRMEWEHARHVELEFSANGRELHIAPSRLRSCVLSWMRCIARLTSTAGCDSWHRSGEIHSDRTEWVCEFRRPMWSMLQPEVYDRDQC
jgi:hypothetical protein